MSSVRFLTRSAYGMHLADQIALVSVPLIAAVVFDASPEVIGILVACQSSAFLFGSIPFGVMIDNMQLKSLALVSTLISLIGFSIAALGIVSVNLYLFGAAITFAGFGIVLFVLAALSIISKSVEKEKIAEANAGIEFPRAIASFAVPLIVGFIFILENAHYILMVGAVGGLLATLSVSRLPRFDVTPTASESVWRKIVNGGFFVSTHSLLLPIAICSIFWNFAFSALLVTMVPLIRDVFQSEPGVFGSALASFGLGAIAGTWLLRSYADKIIPGVILVFGPAISVIAVTFLYFNSPTYGYLGTCVTFIMLGFGPSMWMIAQNSVRQIVTPANMLGRVNATIQTAIYGIRPIGALCGGLVVGAFSPYEGLLLVVVLYIGSLCAAIFSGLKSIRSYSDLETA